MSVAEKKQDRSRELYDLIASNELDEAKQLLLDVDDEQINPDYTFHVHKRNSLLMAAIESGDQKLISMMLERNIGVDTVDRIGSNALQFGILNTTTPLYQLLEFGFTLQQPFDAVFRNDVEFLEGLDAEALSVEDTNNVPVSYYAAAMGNTDILDILVQKDVEIVHARELTGNMFFLAINNGHLNVVQHFVDDLRDSVMFVTKGGIDLLHIAARAGRIDCIRGLIDLGFDPQKDYEKKISPLASAAACGHFDVLEVLVNEFDVPVQEVPNKLVTPLTAAVRGGNLDCVNFMFDHGATIEGSVMELSVKGPFDTGPLFNAMQAYSSMEMFELLAQHLDGPVPQWCLSVACMSNRFDLARHLMDNMGLDVNDCDGWGRSPLRSLMRRGQDNFEFVLELLDRGADPNQQDHTGNTPMNAAQNAHKTKSIELFKQMGWGSEPQMDQEDDEDDNDQPCS